MTSQSDRSNRFISQWVADLDAKSLAPATTRKAYQLLSAALTAAVDNGLIAVSPCRNVRLPKLQAPDMRILEPDDLHVLSESIHERYRAMVFVAGYTGLRFGELCALRNEHFNALRKTIRVEGSLSEIRGEFVFKSPKSEASRRTVSAPTFLVEELAEHLGAFPDPSGLIFTAPGGGPIRRTSFRRRIWMPAVDVSVGQPCTFHDLRHSHAALLIAQGEHPKVIQERLGHASIKTTLDTSGISSTASMRQLLTRSMLRGGVPTVLGAAVARRGRSRISKAIESNDRQANSPGRIFVLR